MTKFKKSRAELETELTEQLLAFRASLQAYDEGYLWEAKRIASSIYILCFDGTGRTKSLLGMLGLKAAMRCISTYNEPAVPEMGWKVTIPNTPLLKLFEDGHRVGFAPAFDINKRPEGWDELPFSKWWEQSIFYSEAELSLSRKNLVFYVRSQDGGGHVDGHLSNMDYRIIRTVGQIGVAMGYEGQEPAPPGNIAWDIIRQIGWEFDESLKAMSL